jgi:hypothetical protein
MSRRHAQLTYPLPAPRAPRAIARPLPSTIETRPFAGELLAALFVRLDDAWPLFDGAWSLSVASAWSRLDPPSQLVDPSSQLLAAPFVRLDGSWSLLDPSSRLLSRSRRKAS